MPRLPYIPITPKFTTQFISSRMSIPSILFGVYQVPPEETKKAVLEALEAGYPGVDSAIGYNNEQEAVDGILEYLKRHPEKKREEIFYTTKVPQWQYGGDTFSVPETYESAKKAIQGSFEKAKGLGYIDLFLVHSPHGGPEKRSATWKALEEAQTEGSVKHIGVSNWGVKHLEGLISKGDRVIPYVNQIEINPWLQHRDIVEYDRKHDIVTESWGPLTRGKRLDDPEVTALAKKYGKTNAQILIRWSIQYGTVPLPKSVSPARIKENLAALDFNLSDEDFRSLGNKNDYFLSEPEWDPTILP